MCVCVCVLTVNEFFMSISHLFLQVVCGLVCGWFVAILFTIPPLFGVAPYRLYKDIGFCGPHFTDANSLWYAITFTLCTFIIPGSLIILCNVKVRANNSITPSLSLYF